MASVVYIGVGTTLALKICILLLTVEASSFMCQLATANKNAV